MRALEPFVVALATQVLPTVAWGLGIAFGALAAVAVALWLADRGDDEE